MGHKISKEEFEDFKKKIQRSTKLRGVVYEFMESKINKKDLFDWEKILNVFCWHDKIRLDDDELSDKVIIDYFLDIQDTRISISRNDTYIGGVIIDTEESYRINEESRKRQEAEKNSQLLHIDNMKSLVKEFYEISGAGFTFRGLLDFYFFKKQQQEEAFFRIKESDGEIEICNTTTAYRQKSHHIKIFSQPPEEWNPIFYDINYEISFFEFEVGLGFINKIIPGGNYKMEISNKDIVFTRVITL